MRSGWFILPLLVVPVIKAACARPNSLLRNSKLSYRPNKRLESTVCQAHDLGCAHCACRYGASAARMAEHLCIIQQMTPAIHGIQITRLSVLCATRLMLVFWQAVGPTVAKMYPSRRQELSQIDNSLYCVFTRKNRLFPIKTAILFKNKPILHDRPICDIQWLLCSPKVLLNAGRTNGTNQSQP